MSWKRSMGFDPRCKRVFFLNKFKPGIFFQYYPTRSLLYSMLTGSRSPCSEERHHLFFLRLGFHHKICMWTKLLFLRTVFNVYDVANFGILSIITNMFSCRGKEINNQ